MIIEICVICVGTISFIYLANRFFNRQDFEWTGKIRDGFAEPLPVEEEDEEEILEEEEEFASVRKRERAEEEEETVEEQKRKEEEE